MSPMAPASSTEEALEHLRKIKPADGWSVETESLFGSNVRLKRRNVPLSDNFFVALQYDQSSKVVVGIVSKSPDGKLPAQGQILVDSAGRPVTKKISVVPVAPWKSPSGAPSASQAARNSTDPAQQFTPEQNKQLLLYGSYLMGALVLFKVAQGLSLVLLPLAYIFFLSTIPPTSSFDAKKELKRVLRGSHLPPDHPDKPRGWLSQTLARVNASVTAEIATGLGYEIEFTTIAAACHIATVTIPSTNLICYWIGANHHWYYLFSREIERKDD
jgi:hypothetical protein